MVKSVSSSWNTVEVKKEKNKQNNFGTENMNIQYVCCWKLSCVLEGFFLFSYKKW